MAFTKNQLQAAAVRVMMFQQLLAKLREIVDRFQQDIPAGITRQSMYQRYVAWKAELLEAISTPLSEPDPGVPQLTKADAVVIATRLKEAEGLVKHLDQLLGRAMAADSEDAITGLAISYTPEQWGTIQAKAQELIIGIRTKLEGLP